MSRKTSSLWGRPPTRYYRFLRVVEESLSRKPITLAVLGCSDGKFVLPAARRGYQVLAIDIDSIALFGGEKTGPRGPTHMPGLAARLRREGLDQLVKVIHGDFVSYKPRTAFDAVFTSGAIQYSRNLKFPISQIINALQHYVGQGGFLYVDYMLPSEERHYSRPNYLRKKDWIGFFPDQNWTIIHHRVLPPLFEAAHVDLPVDHFHTWGHILVRRK